MLGPTRQPNIPAHGAHVTTCIALPTPDDQKHPATDTHPAANQTFLTCQTWLCASKHERDGSRLCLCTPETVRKPLNTGAAPLRISVSLAKVVSACQTRVSNEHLYTIQWHNMTDTWTYLQTTKLALPGGHCKVVVASAELADLLKKHRLFFQPAETLYLCERLLPVPHLDSCSCQPPGHLLACHEVHQLGATVLPPVTVRVVTAPEIAQVEQQE